MYFAPAKQTKNMTHEGDQRAGSAARAARSGGRSAARARPRLLVLTASSCLGARGRDGPCRGGRVDGLRQRSARAPASAAPARRGRRPARRRSDAAAAVAAGSSGRGIRRREPRHRGAATAALAAAAPASIAPFSSSRMVWIGLKLVLNATDGLVHARDLLLDVVELGLAHRLVELTLELGRHAPDLARSCCRRVRSAFGRSFGPMTISATAPITITSPQLMSNMARSSTPRAVLVTRRADGSRRRAQPALRSPTVAASVVGCAAPALMLDRAHRIGSAGVAAASWRRPRPPRSCPS